MEERRGFFEEVVDEELYEEPIPSIVIQGIEREVNRIVNSYNIRSLIEDRDNIRDNLLKENILKKIRKYTGLKPCLVAIDTGFTSPPLELTGGRLLVIIRSHVFQGCSSCGDYPVFDSVGYIRFTDRTEAIAKPLSKIYEREFIRQVLLSKKNGEIDLDLILVDGELFPRTPPGYSSRFSRESYIMKLYKRIVEITNEILRLALETNTALVGVIKRSYGRDIAVRLLNNKLIINDKALATYILKPGEWIDLGLYIDLIYYIKRFLNKYEGILSPREWKALNERLSWITSVIRESDNSSNIGIIVYKAFNPSYYMIATKIEYWTSNKYPLEKLLAYISSITGINGVPHPIDLVDSMAMVRKDLLYLIQQQLFNELYRRTGDKDLALSIAGLTNPEKISRIGMK